MWRDFSNHFPNIHLTLDILNLTSRNFNNTLQLHYLTPNYTYDITIAEVCQSSIANSTFTDVKKISV